MSDTPTPYQVIEQYLLSLDDPTLLAACKRSHIYKKVCDEDNTSFWEKRRQDYGPFSPYTGAVFAGEPIKMIKYINYNCAFESINDQYEVERILGHGFMGMVYILCKEENCNYVLKVEQVPHTGEPDKKFNKQGEYGSIAGTLKIGPKVYDYGQCRNPDNLIFNWIIMEKLDGGNMSEIPIYYVNGLLPTIFDKYLDLIDYGDIMQSDIKGDNVFITDDDLYILDYGLARDFSEYIKRKEMNEAEGERYVMAKAISLIVRSLTYERKRYSTVPDLYSQLSPEKQQEIFTQFSKTGMDWFKNKYGEDIEKYIK